MTDIHNLFSSTSSFTSVTEKITPASDLATPVLSLPELQILQLLATQLGAGQPAAAPQAGTITLFSGPDSAAKFVAAQALASSLHHDLYRVDLNAIVGKYAGDTANALTQLLNSSAASGAILFFDEADALFSKRTTIQDSHDRYASQSTGEPDDDGNLVHLLEQYPGITILAVNSTDGWNVAQLARKHTTLKFPLTS